MYYQGQMSRNEVQEAANALAQAVIRVDEDKRWLAETDKVIVEAIDRDRRLREASKAKSSE